MTPHGIWMAEDDPDDRLMYQDVLHQMRLNEPIIMFSDGKAVFDELLNPASTLPRLLILDGLMPVLNGWEVIDKMQGSARLRNIRAVLLTGHPIRHFDNVPLTDLQVEQKPSCIKDIEEMLERLLQNVSAQ